MWGPLCGRTGCTGLNAALVKYPKPLALNMAILFAMSMIMSFSATRKRHLQFNAVLLDSLAITSNHVQKSSLNYSHSQQALLANHAQK